MYVTVNRSFLLREGFFVSDFDVECVLVIISREALRSSFEGCTLRI